MPGNLELGGGIFLKLGTENEVATKAFCPGFGWDRVSFPCSSCHVVDLVPEEC